MAEGVFINETMDHNYLTCLGEQSFNDLFKCPFLPGTELKDYTWSGMFTVSLRVCSALGGLWTKEECRVNGSCYGAENGG